MAGDDWAGIIATAQVAAAGVTVSSLLETKLPRPRPRRALVPRPRLHALLDQCWHPTLTLVAGPAEFGKTTLLAEWSTRVPNRHRAARLSLDERDSQPSSFWTYVISSLRTVAPDLRSTALGLLRAPHAPPMAALESLLNDLQSCQSEVVLILDDYHPAQSADVQQGTAFLIERLPVQAHLVIATRADRLCPWRRDVPAMRALVLRAPRAAAR